MAGEYITVEYILMGWKTHGENSAISQMFECFWNVSLENGHQLYIFYFCLISYICIKHKKEDFDLMDIYQNVPAYSSYFWELVAYKRNILFVSKNVHRMHQNIILKILVELEKEASILTTFEFATKIWRKCNTFNVGCEKKASTEGEWWCVTKKWKTSIKL